MATTSAKSIPKPDNAPGAAGTTQPLSLPSATGATPMSPPIPVAGAQLFDLKPLASPKAAPDLGGAGRNPDGTAPGDHSPSY